MGDDVQRAIGFAVKAAELERQAKAEPDPQARFRLELRAEVERAKAAGVNREIGRGGDG